MCTEMPARKPTVTGTDNRLAMPPSLKMPLAGQHHADHQRQRDRMRGIIRRAGGGERGEAAGEDRRDGGIGAAGQEAVAAQHGETDRARHEGKEADLRLEAAEPGGRHLFGDRDRGERQPRDQVGREVGAAATMRARKTAANALQPSRPLPSPRILPLVLVPGNYSIFGSMGWGERSETHHFPGGRRDGFRYEFWTSLDGQITSLFRKLPVLKSSPLRKNIHLPFFVNTCISLAIPLHSRGAFRDRHERWRRDAVDVSAQQTSAFDADGQAVWSCPPDAGVKLCMTNARRRWLTSPVHRGERGAAVKTIAQGVPVVRLPCDFLRAQSAHFSARKARGCGQHPALPAPSRSRGTQSMHNSGSSVPRECRGRAHFQYVPRLAPMRRFTTGPHDSGGRLFDIPHHRNGNCAACATGRLWTFPLRRLKSARQTIRPDPQGRPHKIKSNGRPRQKTGAAKGNKREYFHDHFTS